MSRDRRHRSAPARAAGREERRESYLDAAIAVVRRDGPAASMQTIASACGVTKPILYRHFGDRAGLIRAVAERFGTELNAEIDAALGGGLEGRALAAATIDAYLGFVERDPAIARFLIHRSLGDVADAGVALSGFVRAIGERVTIAIGEAIRRAGGDSGAAEPLAYGIVGMVHLAADWWLERRTLPRERLVEYLTTLVWDGLGSLEAGRATVTELGRRTS